MYRCQSCRKQSKPGEAQNKRVVETRKRTYENVIKRGKKSITIRSEGSEIVKEVALCSGCAEKHSA